MTIEQIILERLQQLDNWRWDGLIDECEYRERAVYWRRALVAAREGLGFPVSCEDAGFCWSHNASVEMPLGADCQEYLFYHPRFQ